MPTFVLIGHCGPDSYLLKNAINRAVPEAKIVFADDDDALRPHLKPESILLVNRLLDGGFDEDTGVELIARFAQSPTKPRMLLVSNHDDAQQQAEAVGALPGFGKREVNSARATERLRNAAQTIAQS